MNKLWKIGSIAAVLAFAMGTGPAFGQDSNSNLIAGSGEAVIGGLASIDGAMIGGAEGTLAADPHDGRRHHHRHHHHRHHPQ